MEKTTPPLDDLLTASVKTGRSPHTLRAWVRIGRITEYRVGRKIHVDVDEVRRQDEPRRIER